MDILAISQHVAIEMELSNPGRFLISITEPGEDNIKFRQRWDDILHLQFDDIDRPTTPIHYPEGGKSRNLVLFTEQQAGRILNFVQENSSSIKMLVIHCHAGISRSVAVKVAMEYIINNIDIYSRYPLHNKHVYKTIINEHRKKFSIGALDEGS